MLSLFRAVAFAAALVVSAPAVPQTETAATCEPVQVVVQTPTMAPNSTYSSNGEPPKRFGHSPSGVHEVAFGQDNIDHICGVPPCSKIFLGCTRGDTIVLPDPFSMSDEEFARIVRHELAHVNGWPATHGD